jgi:HPt (histidine-containing phosphotransfer) domain-containing protein
VKKFVLKVPNDPSYDLLCTSIEKGDMDEAFRAAHTLKGISQNLSLTGLYKTVGPLSDYLKVKKEYTDEVASMMAEVSEAYHLMKTSVLQLEA